MVRKHDLLAICLLMFTSVLVAAMATDPKGFSILAWQQLLAALVALVGAGIIFRGATLAYRAAMAKIDLDRELNQREVRRRQRGFYLRTRFAAFVIAHDTRHFAKLLSLPEEGEPKRQFKPSAAKLRTAEGVEEAWANLDVFPGTVAEELFSLKREIINYEHIVRLFGDETIELTATTFDEKVKRLQRIFGSMTEIGTKISVSLRKEIKSIAE